MAVAALVINEGSVREAARAIQVSQYPDETARTGRGYPWIAECEVDGTAYSDLDWAKVSGWLETRRGFVLRTGPDRASPFYPVPNRAFAESGQRQRFRELLIRRIGPAAQK